MFSRIVFWPLIEDFLGLGLAATTRQLGITQLALLTRPSCLLLGDSSHPIKVSVVYPLELHGSLRSDVVPVTYFQPNVSHKVVVWMKMRRGE